jgi:hypothetical protein
MLLVHKKPTNIWEFQNNKNVIMEEKPSLSFAFEEGEKARTHVA